MIKTGPYQYCDTCKTEKNHSWIAELTFWCNTCQSKTTVPQTAKKRLEVIDDTNKYEHLTEETLAKKIGDALFSPRSEKPYKDPTEGMGPGAKIEFDKAMKKEVARLYPATPDECITPEEIKQPTPTIGWGSKLR